MAFSRKNERPQIAVVAAAILGNNDIIITWEIMTGMNFIIPRVMIISLLQKFTNTIEALIKIMQLCPGVPRENGYFLTCVQYLHS